VVYVTKAVLAILREQGSGHTFHVSSLSARIGGVGLSAYQSAKWAVSGFSTGLAQEVAPFGVTVTVLEPSGMVTDWAGSSMTIPPVSEPYQQSVASNVVLNVSPRLLDFELARPAAEAARMRWPAGTWA
jgi:NAD(P)-dependent dehydrogenase (short-subunit alcohol dehydrogenase family)